MITEIPAGTNKKLILFVSAVPTVSTCSSLTMPVHNAINSKTRPITEAGIGIGINDSIILAISKTAANVKACWKNDMFFLVELSYLHYSN